MTVAEEEETSYSGIDSIPSTPQRTSAARDISDQEPESSSVVAFNHRYRGYEESPNSTPPSYKKQSAYTMSETEEVSGQAQDPTAQRAREHPNAIDTTPNETPANSPPKERQEPDAFSSNDGDRSPTVNLEQHPTNRDEDDAEDGPGPDELEMTDAMAEALAIDEKNDETVKLPYHPSDLEDERMLQWEWRAANEEQPPDTFQEPKIERTGAFINVVQPTNTTSVLSAAPWSFGQALSVCYVTWNMAQNSPPGRKKKKNHLASGAQSPSAPRTPEKGTPRESRLGGEVEAADSIASLIQPCAHIIAVCTQENGPYVGTDRIQGEWVQMLKQTLQEGVKEQIEILKVKNFQRNSGRRLSNEREMLIIDDAFYDHLEYTEIAQVNMMATHMIVLCRKDVAKQVSLVHTALEKTGIMAGTVGNKGGLGIAFTLGTPPSQYSQNSPRLTPQQSPTYATPKLPQTEVMGSENGSMSRANCSSSSPPERPATAPMPLPESPPLEGNVKSGFLSLLFIGAHLTAHQENVSKRNDDYKTIVSKLKVGSAGPFPAAARKAVSDSTLRDATEEFDLVFFGGDLNYRIKGVKGPIERMVENYKSLRLVLAANDQLTIERREGRIFHHFLEGPLLFRPTYKYHMDKATKQATHEYDKSAKGRMAAYCDRVLYKKHVGFNHPCQLCHYSDVRTIRTSDHLPVTAMFTIGTPKGLGPEFAQSCAKENNSNDGGGWCDRCTIQ